MEFRIADTFTDSLSRLTGEEQKSVKTTAFDLQLNPANPGMSFHRIDKARDKNFWSVRVSSDIRLIVHKSESSLMLCYVDHHDKAYQWAERRKLEIHPKTGAAQLVEIRETVQEIVVPVYVQAEVPLPKRKEKPRKVLFEDVSEDELLHYGVPPEWLADVKKSDEDSLLALTDHLPAEASEALLELATGGKPRVNQAPRLAVAIGTFAAAGVVASGRITSSFLSPDQTGNEAFDHPDAQRRFRTIRSPEELALALDYPWEKWTVFLHPEQRQLVERDYGGPARVSGSAGTGKTIVALHRAVSLARKNPDARVLLTTFSDALAHALHAKLKRLLANEPRLGERIDVHSLDAVGLRLYKTQVGPATLVERGTVRELLADAASAIGGHKFSLHFLLTEWEQVVDAWQLSSWDSYRDVARLGRKTRLPEAQRKVLWNIFERLRFSLAEARLLTTSELFSVLAKRLAEQDKVVFDFSVVDEAQDVSVAQLRFLAVLGGGRPNALFFAGDLGQRIFQQPFSWKSVGVDIRGRSKTLRINYRTSHQIRMQADRLLGPEVTDVDGNAENRGDTVSVFNGPPPRILSNSDENSEITAVSTWIKERSASGVLPHEFGVFVRSAEQIERAKWAVEAAGLPVKVLDDHVETLSGHVSISTMHLAKGLEFRAVVVMACDDEVIPLQERIETVGDDADLQEVYDTERQLLYVACTRARDYLLVSGVSPVSEFLDDLKG